MGKSCSVIREYHLENRVVDVELTDNQLSSLFTVLYGNRKISEIAGNNIVVFNKNFEVVFTLYNTQQYYTSTFKWTSFMYPDVLNVAFTVKLSRQVHLMTINIVQVRTADDRYDIH